MSGSQYPEWMVGRPSIAGFSLNVTAWNPRSAFSWIIFAPTSGSTHHCATELSATHAQQLLGLEDPHGFAQRRLADGELEEKLVLLRQDAAVSRFAEQDAPPELIGNLLGETAELNGRLCHRPPLRRFQMICIVMARPR
jgi:hypothetical protein